MIRLGSLMADGVRPVLVSALAAVVAAPLLLASCDIRGEERLRLVGPGTIFRENAMIDRVDAKRTSLEKLRKRRDAEAKAQLMRELDDLAAWWTGYLAAERRRAADPDLARELPSWEERSDAMMWLTCGCQVVFGVADRGNWAAVPTLRRMLDEGKGDGDIVIVNCLIRALGEIGDAAALPDLVRYLEEASKGTDPAYAVVGNPFNHEALAEAIVTLRAVDTGTTSPARGR